MDKKSQKTKTSVENKFGRFFRGARSAREQGGRAGSPPGKKLIIIDAFSKKKMIFAGTSVMAFSVLASRCWHIGGGSRGGAQARNNINIILLRLVRVFSSVLGLVFPSWLEKPFQDSENTSGNGGPWPYCELGSRQLRLGADSDVRRSWRFATPATRHSAFSHGGMLSECCVA